MTALATVPEEAHALRTLVDRASSALADARTAAEVLDARDMAFLAYDTAKRTARLHRVRQAHDDLIGAAHRAQAHALEIESQAKHRLADEYSTAQLRGEVARHGGTRRSKVSGGNLEPVPTASDLGLSKKELHDARLIRDAEVADPGIVRRTLDERLARGEEPTRAALRRAARDKLQRSFDRLKITEESVRRLEAGKAPPLTDAERARRAAVFGTPEDRAIHERLVEIVERIDEQPTPGEAVRRIPPASRHAVEIVPVRRAAAWLNNFSKLYEQEVQNGTNAFE